MKQKGNWNKKLALQVAVALLAGTMAGSTALAADNGPDSQVPENDSVDVYELEDTVVTAERMPTKKMETPANTAVITAKEIEDNHYQSVDEAIGHVNGVSIVRMAGGLRSYVRINGDDRVVIMVDGQKLNDDQGGFGRANVDMNMIPSMDNIQRIEVVKGGGSALYGSDAVGGVVNIITKNAVKNETKVDINTGSWGSHNYSISTQGKEKDFSWFITGGLQKRGHFDYKFNGNSPTMANSDYNNNSFSMKLKNRFSDSDSIAFSYAHRSVDDGQYVCNGLTSSPNSRLWENFNNYNLTWNFKEDTAVPGYVRFFYNYKWIDQSGSFSNRMMGLDAQYGWKLNDTNTLITGVEWHQSNSENAANGYYGKKLTNKSVFLQDTWKFADKWTLVPGLRMDNHSMFGTHWSPKVAINYVADADTQVYASWGRVFKAPTADDLYYYADYGSYGKYYGNPNLRPETGYTETIGINHNINENTSIGFSVFQSELHDAINWMSVGTNNYVQNVDKEKRRGMELSFKQELSPMWSYDLGYSYIKRELAKNGGPMDVDTANLQPNGYRIGIHYNSGAWKANLLGTIGSGLDAQYYNNNSSYNVWDFNLSYDIKKNITTYFKVNNITNQEYFEQSNSPGYYYPCAGRFYQVGLTCTF
ncbi:TonB-dependent receptor plug domain-containing protein [Anaerovibrio sp.]|uniref:TonB-dependent receptor plug domain-containing protein n=1 Tax=Anaerovibrio sp. TaxID=1872532 RepID=UPI003F183D55